MREKIWVKIWFLIVSSLLVIGVFNFVVDPYQQYRKASFYKLPYEDERELNAGLAKNFDFDSVVIGSSMMENFTIYDLKHILKYNKPIKLTMAGSSSYEQKLILNTAFRHKKIKNVLLGMDFFAYYGSVKRLKHGESFFPFYLYDESFFNDYKYIFSSDTLRRSFHVLFSRKKKELYDYNKMYEWHSRNQNKKDLLPVLYKKWNARENFDNEATAQEKNLQFMVNNFNTNLKSIIKEHPNVHFILFFPPYSILAYKVYEERDELKDFIKFKEYVARTLASYKNVSLYDFEFAENVTYNLQNYFDLYHYNKNISRWILMQISAKHYRVHIQNYKEKNKKFLQKIEAIKINATIFEKK
jgi:hypothetical protein